MSSNPEPSNKLDARELAASYLQARKEMWVMLGAWAFFFVLVTAVCATMGGDRMEDGSVATLFGLPRWVVFGVVGPWLLANGFIYWFSFHFMRDTPLDEEE